MYQAVNGVLEDYDTIADLLESVEHFLNRLEIYTKIPPTLSVTEIDMAEISMAEISEMIVKILVEVLSILALATKQLQQGTLSEYVLGEILYY